MTDFKLDNEKIIRFFSGKYNDEDAQYVKETFCDGSKEEALKHQLLRQFYELPVGEDVENKNLDHILHKIHYNINMRLADSNVSTSANIIKWTFRIAGLIMLPVVIFFALQTFKSTATQKEAWVEIKAPAWTRAQFSLPDGTTGWLNSSSSLKYNGTFNTDRQVTLKGEAFFNVYKDKERPFVVNTTELNVKVLGTRFNIASYDNEKNVEVVLEEGKIILENKKMEKSLPMENNQLYVYDKRQYNYSTREVDVQKYVSWTSGKLVFRNDPLDVIAKRLERWYNVDVEVDVSSTEDFTWRATFVDEKLEDVLDMLKRSFPLNYKIENQYLKPDESYSKKKVIITLKAKQP